MSEILGAEAEMRIFAVVGARPNFMKVAPLVREAARHRALKMTIIHTGQHYDEEMSDVFFRDLEIPRPEVHLNAGSGSQAVQTGKIMVAFEAVCDRDRPDLVLVVGDVNSTLACSVVAAKAGVPVAHVEAGLRSFDRRMPEEINRIVTDALSDYLFITSPDAEENLRREGVASEKIYFVGNVMIDTLRRFAEKAEHSDIRKRLGLNGSYALVTLHRPSNVDRPESLRAILGALEEVASRLPVLFPIHPRTRSMAKEFGVDLSGSRVQMTEPLGYLEFLHLQHHAKLVLTDSGGIQEETTVLGVPCLTLRDNTERPITLNEGTNVLVGSDPSRILAEVERVMEGPSRPHKIPQLWDGKAAERIVEVLLRISPKGN